MLKSSLFIATATAMLAASGFAGHPVETYKQVVAPEPIYGTGFYFGLQAGANLYQDYGDGRSFDVRGNSVSFDANDEVGFVGGIKLGYVFGTGSVRPAIEADLYYNGVKANIDAHVNGEDVDFNASGDLHSGAFIANFLLRFASGQFQPYLGGGVGGYYAEAQDVRVRIGDRKFEGGGGSNSGFAWQLIGGADYYFTEKLSIFAEYKFLNYEDAGFDDRISQHIAVLGLRMHF
jgi:opacity protein-like surface antigen